MHSKRLPHALLALLAPFLLACQTVRGARPASPTSAAVLRVYDTRASRWVDFAEMTRSAAEADLIFFGEQHDDPVTHGAELAVLAAIGERRGAVVLSLEMFERDVQPVLDRYLAGTVGEPAFLAESRPWDRYTTDYRPLVELARVRGWPVVASNIPRPIASAVSRRGLAHLDTLNAVERKFAAAENACPRDEYFDRFAETVGAHGAGAGPQSAGDVASSRALTERFYEAQCVKDEAMGESVAAAFVRGGRSVPVLHVDGSFHSDFGQGTVERARRRERGAKIVILTAVPVADLATADGTAHRARADYVIFTLARTP